MSRRYQTTDDRPLAPGLYLVATPIGNLEDITLRALRVLRHVDRIACEDTRQTQKLLNHFEIRTPTVSYHMHNEGSRTEELVAELKQGRTHRRSQRRRHSWNCGSRRTDRHCGTGCRCRCLSGSWRKCSDQRTDRKRPSDREIHLPWLSSGQSRPAEDSAGGAAARQRQRTCSTRLPIAFWTRSQTSRRSSVRASTWSLRAS